MLRRHDPEVEPGYDGIVVAEPVPVERRDDLAGPQVARPGLGDEQAVAVVGDFRGVRPPERLGRRPSGVGLLPAVDQAELVPQPSLDLQVGGRGAAARKGRVGMRARGEPVIG